VIQTLRASPRPLWQRAVIFCLAFWTGAKISQFLSVTGSSYVSFWLPAGIYVATLLLNPTRTWPWFLLAALVANLAFDLPHGTPLGTTLGFYLANTVEALTGAWLVRRFVAERPDISVLKEFFGLAVCTAGLATLAGATIGAAILTSSGLGHSFFFAWATWWGNEAMAILLVAPLLMVWLSNREPEHRFNKPWQWIEAAVLLAGLSGVAWFLLVDYKGITGPYKIWLLVFLLWAALRFGLRGATLANLVLALLMCFLTTHFLKGLTAEQVATGEYVGLLQSFLGVSVVMTLIPAITLCERDRKVAELRESEVRFRHLTEASFEAVCITENGRLLDVNDQGLKMLGYSREEVIGRDITDCVAPETRAQVVEMIRAGTDATYEHRIIRKDGSSFYAEARAKVVRLGDRTVRMTAVRDITERKKMEEALKAGESRLRLVLDTLPAAAYTCDARGLITYYNQDAAFIWGRLPKLNDPVDRFCGSFKLFALDGTPIPHDQCWMAEALAERWPVIGRQIVIERPDGTRRVVLAHASPLFDTAGNLEGAVNVLTDITELKQAKQALADSESLLRHFIKQTPVAVAMFDNDMRYLQTSDRWLDDYGLAGKNIVGRLHYDVFPDLSDRWKEVHRRVLAGSVEQSDRDMFVRASGSTEWIQWEAQPWHKTDGSIGGLIISTQVITERIRIEEALRMSEEMFRSALLHSPIGMALVSPDGRWIEVNPALCKIVGYSQSDLLATDFQTITHPEDLSADVNCVRQMLDRQIESYEMEKRYLHKLGHIVWIQINVSLVWNPDGTPRYFVSQVQDITERKRAATALQEYQAKLVLTMDMAKLAAWEYDVASDRMTVDERLFKYYGMVPAEQGSVSLSASDYIRKFVHPEDAPAIAEELAKGVATTDPNYTRQYEKRIIRADGSIAVMLTRFTIAKDATGRTVKAYGANQDITEQKRTAQQQDKLEEQLRLAQKMEALGTLAGGTAHEFNNMLGIILGYSELIRAELDNGHPCQSDLNEILKAGQRAKEIIQQILTFSRQQRQPREQVQLTDIVREALKLVHATLPATVAIHEEITGGDPFILANPTQIHQVLMNICINAWHAMDERGGAIRVALRTVRTGVHAGDVHPNLRNGTYVHLSIADNGKGMEAATLNRIFEPFFTTKGQGKGTGLGLAVVHGIMQAHEGVVFAQSTPGAGATFHLYFPACAVNDPALKKPKMETKPASKNGHHILLVDDEPSLIQITSKFLQRAGYQTTSVRSGMEALQAFERQPGQFHLVITDLTMPEMSGAVLAQTLNANHPTLPVVIISGFDGAEALNGDATPNIRALLQKPFTPDMLVRTIRSALAGQTTSPAPS
jgi:two-component system cell cycle sensor histidine kinase/response regulator CckA